MGKYPSKLYHNGLSSHSNATFGTLTLISIFFIVYGAWSLLTRSFRREDAWIMDAPDIVDYSEWALRGKSLQDYLDMGLQMPSVSFQTLDHIHWWWPLNNNYWWDPLTPGRDAREAFISKQLGTYLNTTYDSVSGVTQWVDMRNSFI
jgi:hypothetical protein